MLLGCSEGTKSKQRACRVLAHVSNDFVNKTDPNGEFGVVGAFVGGGSSSGEPSFLGPGSGTLDLGSSGPYQLTGIFGEDGSAGISARLLGSSGNDVSLVNGIVGTWGGPLSDAMAHIERAAVKKWAGAHLAFGQALRSRNGLAASAAAVRLRAFAQAVTD